MPVKVGKIEIDLKKQKRAILQRAAERCAKAIAAGAPVGKWGDYSGFWTWEFDGEDKVVVFNNGPHRSLSHLLEKGHLVQKADGSHGWSPANPHIRPAFMQVKDQFLEDCKSIDITHKGV